jgi:RHS repeat-associated protein
MLQPGRKYSSANGYRYGFNGKENDKEVKGDGNNLDFGGRIYDSRLGRFISVDYKAYRYESYTPYIYGLNDPTYYIDIDGKDIIGLLTLQYKNSGGVAVLNVLSNNQVWKQLTGNFAAGGMYDKMKIDLQFSNRQIDSKTDKSPLNQKEPGSFTPSSGSDGLYEETGMLVKVKNQQPKSIFDLKESEVKDVERWIIGVKTDPRLFSDGVYGVLSHAVSTHVQTQSGQLADYLNGKMSLQGLKDNLQAEADKEKADKRSTDDHKQIANNTGNFFTLNASFLNQVGGVPGALVPLKSGSLEIGGEYNRNNDASKPTLNTVNSYNYFVKFLNEMVQSYLGPQNSQNAKLYKYSTQPTVNNGATTAGPPVAPIQ